MNIQLTKKIVSIMNFCRHWQSENVLLQVCLKESFPKTADVNPPMNCQELPYVSGLAVTEVILPKASLVDVNLFSFFSSKFQTNNLSKFLSLSILLSAYFKSSTLAITEFLFRYYIINKCQAHHSHFRLFS